MTQRIYIAGPMTGLPENNAPAFNAVAARLREAGVQVENPAENTVPPGSAWLDYMRAAIPRLVRCDGVLLLPGWGKSRGASVECQLALGLGLEVAFLDAANGIRLHGIGRIEP